jgi:hypothetical protein
MSDDRASKQSEGDALYDVFSALSEKQKRRFLKRISDERRALRDAGRPLGRARIRGAPAMEDDEILGALRDCTAETGAVPTFARYVAWVNRPDVKVRPGRRPTSHLPFKRAFGSFAAARVAAGLMEAADDTALPSQRVIRGAAPRATAQQATANLREVRDRLGRWPNWSEYHRARREIFAESSAAGKPRALLARNTINNIFGSWSAARMAAEDRVNESRGVDTVERKRGSDV